MYFYSLQDFELGDRVVLSSKVSIYGTAVPKYLESEVLTVIGFTKKSVKCQRDSGGDPISILPEYLEKL